MNKNQKSGAFFVAVFMMALVIVGIFIGSTVAVQKQAREAAELKTMVELRDGRIARLEKDNDWLTAKLLEQEGGENVNTDNDR